MFAKDFRRLAREHAKGHWGILILVFLIYSLIASALATTGIGALILTGPLTIGLVSAFLSLVRSGQTKPETLFEGFTENFVDRMLLGILQPLFIALWSLLFVIPGIVKSYSYAMAPYIMRDNPGISATEAITRSRQMMRGNKWRLFCLHLSFIGWVLLSVLTFGILTIFVAPYMQLAVTEFYESIKDAKTAE